MAGEYERFGLTQEWKIKNSNVREIFTPSKPINSLKLFFGREKQVKKIIEFINTPGLHALLFGDRGVGKSSLANIVANALTPNYIHKDRLYIKRCDSKSTFLSVINTPLKKIGFDQNVVETSSREKISGKAGAKILGIEAGSGVEKENSRKSKRDALTPSAVSELLADQPDSLFLIDEFDALPTTEKHQIAELVKQLSDTHSKFKLLLVGIAETASDLTGGHPSVTRCLKQTKLDRMPIEELKKIVIEGSDKLKISFEDAVINKIVKISAGYPHFTHLLALKSAELVISSEEKIVKMTHLHEALKVAVDDAEQTLRDQFDISVRGQNHGHYCIILSTAASFDSVEFSASHLLAQVNRRIDSQSAHKDSSHRLQKITPQGLNNYLPRLVSDDNTKIFRRKSKGIYAFNDPRMPSYVKMALNHIAD